MIARRGLDAAMHCPPILKHALALSAASLARAAVTGDKKDLSATALIFVETLVGEGVRRSAKEQLERVTLSNAVKHALVHAAPAAFVAAAKQDRRQGLNVAGSLAKALVEAKVKPLVQESESLAVNYRNAALEVAPSAALAAIRQGKGDGARLVCEFVGRAGVVSVDHLANKFVAKYYQDIFRQKYEANQIVKAMVLREWLMAREFVVPVSKSLPGIVGAAQLVKPYAIAGAAILATGPVWQQQWTKIVYTTTKSADLFNVPLPPDIRQAFIPHYLHTMDACLALEKQFESKGIDVLRITGENQLIRENFKGQVFRRGVVVPKFPDAQLQVRNVDGSEEAINVEYVTKSYTPAMIRDKAKHFKGPTVWAVDSRATAAKVTANVGNSANIILV